MNRGSAGSQHQWPFGVVQPIALMRCRQGTTRRPDVWAGFG